MKKTLNTTQFFYQNGKLVTVNQAGQPRSIFRNADIPLAEHQLGNSEDLLATDDKGSVLAVQGERNEANRPDR